MNDQSTDPADITHPSSSPAASKVDVSSSPSSSSVSPGHGVSRLGALSSASGGGALCPRPRSSDPEGPSRRHGGSPSTSGASPDTGISGGLDEAGPISPWSPQPCGDVFGAMGDAAPTVSRCRSPGSIPMTSSLTRGVRSGIKECQDGNIRVSCVSRQEERIICCCCKKVGGSR